MYSLHVVILVLLYPAHSEMWEFSLLLDASDISRSWNLIHRLILYYKRQNNSHTHRHKNSHSLCQSYSQRGKLSSDNGNGNGNGK